MEVQHFLRRVVPASEVENVARKRWESVTPRVDLTLSPDGLAMLTCHSGMSMGLIGAPP